VSVNLIAPDGSPVNTDPEHVESLLADGYQLADAGASPPPGPMPASGAGRPLAAIEAPGADVVNLRAPDGSAVNADREHVESLLADGYQLAETRDVSAQRSLEANSTLDAQAITAAEQFGQGATMGAYGAVAGLSDDGYAQRMDERAAANPTTAAVAGVAGAMAPALLSGGVGSVGAMARLTPAGQLANLATKMGTALTARAGGALGRVGALTLTGAAEGAVDMATRRVMDDLAAGNVDITAERVLDAAWDGAKWGGLAAGGLGLAAEGVGAAARGAGRVAQAAGERLGTLSDQAGSAAFKAAVGRTSIAAQRLAARVGGDAEIGKTLLKRGVIADTLGGGHTVDDIAERLPGALEEAGGELGNLQDEVADAATSRKAILSRIEQEVISPLDKAGTKDIAAAVRAKLQNSGIVDELASASDEAISLRELHELRRRFDQRPDLKWGSSGPAPVDITTDAMRDVRRTIESAFEAASDEAAKLRGVDDFAARLKQAKREYSHLAVANQVSEQGSFARAANNRLGLDDVLAGVAGAASMGPAGALAAVGSKLIRDRSESVIAATLYRLARGAVKKEQAIQGAVENTIHSLAPPTRAYKVPLDTTAKVAAMNEAEVARAAAEGTGRGRYTLVDVPLEQIDLPKAWSDSKAHSIKQGLSDEATMPPVRLAMGDNGRLSVEDGIHRTHAVREAGATHVPAIVEEFIPAGAKEPPPLRFADNTQTRPAAGPARRAMSAVSAATRGAVPAANIEAMVAQARALQDPESPESHQLEAMTLQMASESPDFADAMRNAVRRKADFVVRTLGPETDPSDPSGTSRVHADPVTRGRRERFMQAAADPTAAMQRLASGRGSAEDLAVVRELTPQVHKAWVDQVLGQIQSGQIKPTIAQRQRLLASHGVPVYREQTPEYIRFYQQLVQGAQQPQDQQAPQGLPPSRQPKFDGRDFKVDQHFASRADSLGGPPGG
jgi:hypothetical protein